MMPKMDGFTLAKEIRKVNQYVPIIFLTAKNMKSDIVEGFKIGADDYLTKPFSMDELVYRIEAIMRRTNNYVARPKSVYYLGDYVFDTARQSLTCGEEVFKLTTKESELLVLLCRHRNQVLGRDFALKTIWADDNYFNARSMDVYISKLRKFFKLDPRVEINNVHGRGYRLVAPGE
jgi:DNA-binding response OmpR family regulator